MSQPTHPSGQPAHPNDQPAVQDDSRFLQTLGWVATATAMAMYVAYVPQIINNVHGHKSNWLQPLVAGINCTLWVMYGLLKKPRRDLPVAIANAPGILFGLAAFITAL